MAMVSTACIESASTIVGVTGVPVELAITVDLDDGMGGPAASPATLELEVGSSASLAALATNTLGLPIGAGPVSWSSSDGLVVTVGSDGVVTAVGEGSAEVTAAVGDVSAALSVVVTVP
jgi:uncharacterized protein YjdB